MNVKACLRGITWLVFGLSVLLLLLFSGADAAGGPPDSEVYLVMLKQQPVMAYRGTIPGFAATRVRPGYRLNVGEPNVVAYREHLLERHNRVFTSVCGNDVKKKISSVTNTLNAFSASLTQKEVQALQQEPDVERVTRAPLFRTQMTNSPSLLNLPKTLWKMNGSNTLGEDIVIGVIDSGIYPEHPSFNASGYGRLWRWKGRCTVTRDFRCNNKIVSAAFFNGAILAEDNTIDRSSDFASPRGKNGHGTHVAAIAAGNSNVPVKYQGVDYGRMSGVAPRARLAIYKAMWNYKGDKIGGVDGEAVGSIADLVSAVERAVSDGVDVINFSNGFDQPKGIEAFLTPLEIQFLVASRAGVLISVSAGNNRFPGASNDDGGSIPFVSPWYLSVASASTPRVFMKTVTVTYQRRTLTLSGVSPTAAVRRARVVRAEDVYDFTESFQSPYCDEGISAELAKGKIVMCKYEFARYSNNIVTSYMKEQGAIGIIFLQTVTGGNRDPLEESANLDLPVIFLNVATAYRLDTFITSILSTAPAPPPADCSGRGTPTDPGTDPSDAVPDPNDPGTDPTTGCEASTQTVEIFASISRTTIARNGTAPSVSFYSSNGPDIGTPDVLKPDILAPGETILSAWTPQAATGAGMFKFASGTSMAAPHVAGMLAIMRQRFRTWSAAAIYSAMRTTATTFNNQRKPIISQESGRAGDSFDFGYGFVNTKGMVNPGLIYDAGMADYVNFFCSLGLNANSLYDMTGITCTGAVTRPSDLNLPSIVIGNLSFKRTFRRRVTNVGPKSTYTVVVKPPPSYTVTVSPTSLVLKRGQNATFDVTITPRTSTKKFSFGSLTWSDVKGRTVVTPIIVRSRSFIGQPFG